jgi:CheY-specific phosphatase CheX
MASSGKERAASSTLTEIGNVIIMSKEEMLQLKREVLKILPPAHFYEDRTKFQAYVL